MQKQYKRIELTVTEFDAEDVITTSGVAPDVDPTTAPEDPIHVDHGSELPFGSWF